MRLDELTMPKRFWPESPDADSAGLPPAWGCLTTEDLWNLQRQMIFYWYRLTIVALIITAVAVVLMLAPVSSGRENNAQCWSFYAALLGLLLGFGYAIALRLIARRKFPPFSRGVD